MTEKKIKTKGTNFVFTDFLPNNIEKGYHNVYNEWKDMIRGIAWGLETCPKSGKLHNQCYIQVYKQCRFTQIQKWIKSKAHFEVMEGSIKQNEKYCSKEQKYTKLGMFVEKGFRSDFHNIKEDLKQGATLFDIMDNYTGDYVRYHVGIKSMKHLIDREKYKNVSRDIVTKIFVGLAGAGKSHCVYNTYGYSNVFTVNLSGKGNYFDDYEGEKIILFDDFQGNVKYGEMLRILDKYPYRCNVKYGTVYAQWEKVYLTSNVKPCYWYKKMRENFIRRISEVREFCLEVTKGNTKRLSHVLKNPWERDYNKYCEGYDKDFKECGIKSDDEDELED